MQSTNIRQIKAALWNQAFIGETRVSCPMGQVVGIRRRKGQLEVPTFLPPRIPAKAVEDLSWPYKTCSLFEFGTIL